MAPSVGEAAGRLQKRQAALFIFIFAIENAHFLGPSAQYGCSFKEKKEVWSWQREPKQ